MPEQRQALAGRARLGERVRELEESYRATLNILEDIDEERVRANDTQRALLNMLEDIESERLTAEEAKALYESVNRTAAELARSNESLEQFAYVASQDLQEPLRIMASYSQLLERRYTGRLDSDADEFIEYIVKAAKRMQTLITDLLAYSRAGRAGAPLSQIDCSEALDKALYGLGRAIEESGARLTRGPLPTITGNETHFIQLFQNLVGNALKFRSAQAPHVHVGAQRRGDDWLFSVRDNGIGIAQKYRDKIFVIFQRLHGGQTYPGTGIGLAICKKIVEFHGGKIWVESEPGKGSTFHFTVPARAPEEAVENGRRNHQTG